MNRIFKILANHALKTPEHPAIVSDGLKITYSELIRYIYATVSQLEQNGVTPADTVGISLEHEVQHLILSLSLICLGANQIKLPTFNSLTANSNLAKQAAVSVLISESNIHGYLDMSLSPLNRLQTNALHSKLSNRTTTPRVYLSTSGTTGRPKIFGMYDTDFLHHIKRSKHYASTQKHKVMSASTIESNISSRQRLYAAINGHTNVFKKDKSESIITSCLSHDVSLLNMTKYQITSLLQESTIQLPRRLSIFLAGEPIPNSIRKAIQHKITKNLIICYGTTECGTISTAGFTESDEHETVGLLAPDVKLEIVDEEHNEVPTNIVGEIRIQAPGLGPNYLEPLDNKKHFKDGWFYPGDCGKYLKDGRLVIQGRKDNMFIMNSINIYPEEIERVLDDHQQVSATAALSIPSKIHGQIPVCIVQLTKGASISSRELMDYAKLHLGLRSPRKIVLSDEMPRNNLGKIQRTGLHKYFNQN